MKKSKVLMKFKQSSRIPILGANDLGDDVSLARLATDNGTPPRRDPVTLKKDIMTKQHREVALMRKSLLLELLPVWNPGFNNARFRF